jgi:hypothetical protein
MASRPRMAGSRYSAACSTSLSRMSACMNVLATVDRHPILRRVLDQPQPDERLPKCPRDRGWSAPILRRVPDQPQPSDQVAAGLGASARTMRDRWALWTHGGATLEGAARQPTASGGCRPGRSPEARRPAADRACGRCAMRRGTRPFSGAKGRLRRLASTTASAHRWDQAALRRASLRWVEP